ncbi:MAG: hypothetical protein ABI729_05350 [Chitinophagales bacterium]
MKLSVVMSFLLLFIISSALNAVAQGDLPATDIYILSISKNEKGKYLVEAPEKITPWSGYDNQPYFLPDGTGLLYTSIRDSTKADIYKYVFQFAKTTQVTHTPNTAEYSPMLMPDKTGISCVRVLEDDSTQLFTKAMAHDEYVPLFPNLNPVGYYCWVNNDVAAMFVLGEPQTLQLGYYKTGVIKKVGERIGRCMVRAPGKTSTGFYYVQFDEDSTSSTINFYEMKTGKSTEIVPTLPGEEDFGVMPDGTFLMGSEGVLYKYDRTIDKDWKSIAEFEGTAVEKFYRIVVNPMGDKIAVVTYPDEKP